jgi:hypothetical protein
MAADLCGTTCKKIWTGIYTVTWLLLFVGVIFWMMAVSKLLPSITDLPENLSAGFDSVFGFSSMEADGGKVKDAASAALLKCGSNYPSCSSYSPTGVGPNVDTTVEYEKILAAQANSLTKLKKVTTDKYLGVDTFASSASSLTEIQTKMDDLKIVTNSQCSVQIGLYCGLYESGNAIITGMSGVNDQLDKFTSSDMVKTWKDTSGNLKVMYIFPFILIISALFFCCTWVKDGTCCCRASKTGCCLSCCHVFFWFVFFILVTVIMAVAIVIKMNTDEVKVPVVKDKPTIKVLMDHLEKEFPGFYNKVFKDMIEGLLGIHNASVLMWVFCIVIFSYGCCICCCKPYERAKDSGKVADKPEP